MNYRDGGDERDWEEEGSGLRFAGRFAGRFAISNLKFQISKKKCVHSDS